MKAVVYTKYGPPDVLHLEEVTKPAPKDNEVLIKIFATTVNRTDCATIRAKPFFMRIFTGLLKPGKPIPGTDFAGIIEETGKNVLSLKGGQKVFGFDGFGLGSQAQYMAISEDKAFATIPDNISYEEAAASIEGAHYAYNVVNKVNLKSGEKVLVNGATGAIGSAAVQLLKLQDVYITAVCNTKNIALAKSLGANKVIDYTREDFTKDKDKYILVFDAVGKSSFGRCRPLLQSGGIYISSDLGFLAQNIFLPSITPLVKPLLGNKITVSPFPSDIKRTVLLVKNLIEQGKFKAVIDRKYTLEQIVEAYRYVETGQKTGNVVITVEHNS
jgi:NADPH:quinone reductase-like Zn-dependent oxidoreductase